VVNLDGEAIEGSLDRQRGHRQAGGRAHWFFEGSATQAARRIHDRETATAAVKAAVMVEDVGKVVWLALQIGEVMDIDQEAIEKLHERYAHVYGQ
jgi:hypothetical protein